MKINELLFKVWRHEVPPHKAVEEIKRLYDEKDKIPSPQRRHSKRGGTPHKEKSL